MRPLNLLIGLAVLVGVSLVLFGAMGGEKRSHQGAPPSSDRFDVPALEAATTIAGQGAAQPPPLPATPPFAARGVSPRMQAILGDPSRTVEERWGRALKRIREVFGGSLGGAKENAIHEAVGAWVNMQAQSTAAFMGGYIDSAGLSQHTGWNRNVYLFALQDILGNADYQRFAGGGVDLEELDPL